jgi:hypothetical protein
MDGHNLWGRGAYQLLGYLEIGGEVSCLVWDWGCLLGFTDETSHLPRIFSEGSYLEHE